MRHEALRARRSNHGIELGSYGFYISFVPGRLSISLVDIVIAIPRALSIWNVAVFPKSTLIRQGWPPRCSSHIGGGGRLVVFSSVIRALGIFHLPCDG